MNNTEKKFLQYVGKGYFSMGEDGVIWRHATRRKGAKKHLTWIRLATPRVATQMNGEYLGLKLTLNGKARTVLAHRVAWMLHTGQDIPADTIVNHINGNKHDNSKTNLENATYSENAIHARDVLKVGPWKR